MTIEDSVRNFILEEVNEEASPQQLTNEHSLIENGVIDSLGIFQLVTFLEDEYGIDVMDDELVLSNFGTLQAIADYVRAKLEASGGG